MEKQLTAEQKNVTQTLIKMGFEQITGNQFSNPKMGYIHLQDFTDAEIANKIFELGKWKKTEEIYSVLNIQNLVR